MLTFIKMQGSHGEHSDEEKKELKNEHEKNKITINGKIELFHLNKHLISMHN